MHDQRGERLFGRLGQCADCMRAPLAAPANQMSLDEQPAVAPDGCLTAVERERSLTQIASCADGIARELAEKGEARNIPEACKMFEIAIKAHRAAGEYSQVRERRDYVGRLERQVRKLRGGRN